MGDREWSVKGQTYVSLLQAPSEASSICKAQQLCRSGMDNDNKNIEGNWMNICICGK